MAQEVGVAYVTLLPSGRGFGKAVEGQIDDAVGKSEKKTDGFFSKLGKGLKTAAVGVAAVATGVAALAIGGGISRALNIEDAQAKLKGLGHDTQSVEAIMKDALASVKGTAFGLDAAATTAAAAVASGIKPGKELEGYLRLTADAATIAGVSMEEMGSIMNKVQANGKAQMEDLNRLTERGIPIMQMLADEYGVTAEEMSDMVSRGEVDSDRFRAALEKNLGGAALESGNTTRGAFANMRAALSRLGLVFVEDALGGAKTFFNEVTVILDGLAERFKPWVERVRESLSGAFQIEGFGERFLEGFDRLVSAIQSGPIPQLLAALAPIGPVIGAAAAVLGSVLGDALKELGAALAPILPEIASALADAVVELAPSLTDLLVALVPLIPPLVELLAAVTPLATELLEMLIPAISGLVDALTPGIEAVSLILEYLSGDLDGGGFLGQAAELGGMWGDSVNAVVGFLYLFRETIADVGSFVNDTLTAIGGVFTAVFTAIVSVVSGAIQGVWGFVTGGLAQIGAAIQNALSAISSAWSAAWNWVTSLVSNAWSNITSAVSNGVSGLMSFVSSLPGRIMGALGGLGSMLYGVGQNIIQGLINGVGSMVSAAVSAVKNVGGAMLDGVKSFLGIKSPSRVFRDEVGKMVGLGLLAGIDDSSIRGRIDTAVNHLVTVPEVAAGTGGTSVTQNNTINMLDRDPRLLMRQFGRELTGALV